MRGPACSVWGMETFDAPKFVWGPLPQNISTALPFQVSLDVVDQDGKPLNEYRGRIRFSAIASTVCLSEGFERMVLGRWYAARPRPFDALLPPFCRPALRALLRHLCSRADACR